MPTVVRQYIGGNPSTWRVIIVSSRRVGKRWNNVECSCYEGDGGSIIAR